MNFDNFSFGNFLSQRKHTCSTWFCGWRNWETIDKFCWSIVLRRKGIKLSVEWKSFRGWRRSRKRVLKKERKDWKLRHEVFKLKPLKTYVVLSIHFHIRNQFFKTLWFSCYNISISCSNWNIEKMKMNVTLIIHVNILSFPCIKFSPPFSRVKRSWIFLIIFPIYEIFRWKM